MLSNTASWFHVLTAVLKCLAVPRNSITAGKTHFLFWEPESHTVQSSICQRVALEKKPLLRYHQLRNSGPSRAQMQLLQLLETEKEWMFSGDWLKLCASMIFCKQQGIQMNKKVLINKITNYILPLCSGFGRRDQTFSGVCHWSWDPLFHPLSHFYPACRKLFALRS